MREFWEELEEFPNFFVSNFGEVMNVKTRKYRKTVVNQRGILMVTLPNEDKMTTRSVAVLVASIFVPEDRPRFDTVINLNGDRANCRSDNLAWRPRPFAIEYHRQFERGTLTIPDIPVVELTSDEIFPDVRAAAIRFGVRFVDVLLSCHNKEKVWPGNRIFRFAD